MMAAARPAWADREPHSRTSSYLSTEGGTAVRIGVVERQNRYRAPTGLSQGGCGASGAGFVRYRRARVANQHSSEPPTTMQAPCQNASESEAPSTVTLPCRMPKFHAA